MTIVFVVVVTVILSLVSLRQKNSSWQGTLTKKEFNEGDEDSSDSYSIIFTTESGKKVKMTVGKAYYDQVSIGEKFVKKAGEYMPLKQ
jgi:hypothetical protein